MKVDAKVWWWVLYDTHWMDMMTWTKFREAFEREFLGMDTLYVHVQEYNVFSYVTNNDNLEIKW